MNRLKQFVKNARQKVAHNNERSARKKVLEEFFYDFNRSRAQVYKMNFVRGLMMGAGTVIGGTLVIALFLWILSLLANFIPPLDDFFSGISETIRSGRE